MVKSRRRALSPCHDFFKVYLADFSSRQLSLPPAFAAQLNGKGNVPGKVTLKDHTGKVWDVGLEKNHQDLVISEGWQHFVARHSLADGDFLIFKYDGSCNFDIEMYGRDGLKKRKGVDDDDIPIRNVKVENEEFVDTQQDIRPNNQSSGFTCRGRQPKSVETTPKDLGEGGGKEPAPHHECRKGSVRINSLDRVEKAKALDRASSFQSENPFFMLVMQPSYINAGSGLPIPSSISAKYLTKSTSDIIFKVSGRESWPGVYVHTKVNQRQTQVRVHRGWKKFVQDNGLNVGDVCVFELIQGKEITFNVSIFRSSEQRDDGQAAGRNGNRSQKAPLKDALDKVSSAFKSQHPFFLVPMYPSYVNPGYRLLIPMEFARKHLKPGEKKNATLQVARTKWPVRIINPFRDQLGFSGEWMNFVRGNSLKVGDVCAFELIKSEERVLRVTIFRCSGS